MQDWAVFISVLALALLFLVVFIYTGTKEGYDENYADKGYDENYPKSREEGYRYERTDINDNRAAVSPCMGCDDCGGMNFNSESCKLVAGNVSIPNSFHQLPKSVDQPFKDCKCDDQYSNYPSYYTVSRD